MGLPDTQAGEGELEVLACLPGRFVVVVEVQADYEVVVCRGA